MEDNLNRPVKKIAENRVSKRTVVWQCINSSCQSQSFRRDQLVTANMTSLAFYGVQGREGTVYKICKACQEPVEVEHRQLVERVRKGLPLLQKGVALEGKSGAEEVLLLEDSEGEEELVVTDSGEETELEFSEDEWQTLDTVVQDTMDRFNFDRQLSTSTGYLSERVADLATESLATHHLFRELETSVDHLRAELYSGQQAKTQELPELNILSGEEAVPAEARGRALTSRAGPALSEGQNVLAALYETRLRWDLARVVRREGEGYLVMVEGRGVKHVDLNRLAHTSPPSATLSVGARCLGLRKGGGFYSGVVAEPLKKINGSRYLVFHDDGLVSYVSHTDIRLVCEIKSDVWEEVEGAERKEQVRNYLAQYPERPLVRLEVGQQVKVERGGRWLVTRVVELDVSLVKVRYQGDDREEWLYRGSARLGPMYVEMEKRKTGVNMSVMWGEGGNEREDEKLLEEGDDEHEHIDKVLSEEDSKPGKVRRKRGWEPSDELSTEEQADDTVMGKEDTTVSSVVRQMAKKSTGIQRKVIEEISDPVVEQEKKVEDTANEKENKLVEDESSSMSETTEGEAVTDWETSGLVYPVKCNAWPRKKFQSHSCSPSCVDALEFEPKEARMRDTSPLMLPLLAGWERQLAKHSNRGRRLISYRAPCGRTCRNLAEVHSYLRTTRQALEMDFFNFDWWLHSLDKFKVGRELITSISDISYGLESVPISCVNSIDSSYPEYIDYTTKRLPQGNVTVNTDPAFLTSCDCQDDCQDSDSCDCRQLTIQSTKVDTAVDQEVGYKFRRLENVVITGIYECNSRCRCSNTCLNRVAQKPLRAKLQIFKTAKRGWGVRTLHDLPSGSFVCIYVGNLFDSEDGNKQGRDFGDEYLADLDFIELVESRKKGYESDVTDIESTTETSSKKKGSKKTKTKSSKHGTKKSASKSKESKAKSVKLKSTRKLFGESEEAFIMCAKKIGNVGRYLNHSCNPNVFVQNVLVDTHDVRFPWVAFFTSIHVGAGKELCWDYNYTVGSIPDKVLYCCCGSDSCRGRLL